MTALTLLAPQLRHAILDQLGWQGLRPVQEASIPPILAGENVIILAPTAGGKTEAAFLPTLDLLQREQNPGLGILYVSPLVALLNNQESRAQILSGLLGMTAFKWHGGVGSAARKKFLDDPAQVLLTTPESLEAMLIGRTVPVRNLFRSLRFVIVDEVHAFAGSDRGAHLIAVLERLASFSQHDVQRIGLSATVHNPVVIGQWLKGRSRRNGRVVRPTVEQRAREAFIVTEGQDGAPRGHLISEVRRGKSLVFTESRVDAEQIASSLHEGKVLEYVGTYHSAISLEARQAAEEAMHGQAYKDVCLTCTSAMELGIDIGDLDRVLQIGPPSSVSSLLQRWGRTGRREGRPQLTTIYTSNPMDLLTALAQITLAEEGWAEPVEPRTRAYHILFQQLLNRVLQSGQARPEPLWEELREVSAFRDITKAAFDELVTHLVATNMLAWVSGTLVLGDAAERRLGGRHFQALITSFDTPDVYTVVDVANRFEIGQLESWFVDELRQDMEMGGAAPVILLTGRAWRIQRIHEVSSTIDVTADHSGQAPKWLSGTPRLMHPKLAWRHRELLADSAAHACLDATGKAHLEALRSGFPFLRESECAWTMTERVLTLHTFAGTRINKTLELLLRLHCERVQSGNFSVTCTLPESWDAVDAFTLLLEVARQGLTRAQKGQLTLHLRPMRLSKYQPFLPGWMAQVIVADHLLDLPGLEDHLRQREALLAQAVQKVRADRGSLQI